MLSNEQQKIYEWLENHTILSSSQLAILMGYKDTALVRQRVAELRQAFLDEKVDMLVCYKQNKGYFLSNDFKDVRYLIERNDRQAKTMLYNNSVLKKKMITKNNLTIDGV